MNINEIADRAYNNAVRLGKIGKRSITEKLSDINSEYLEALKAISGKDYARMDLFEKSIELFPEMFKESFEAHIKDTYEDELTDLLSVVLTLMEDCEMNKEKHFKYKQKYNDSRDDHK